MYYPLLRARQFELIALRELSYENNLEHVLPILEPVKDSFNNFKLAFEFFKKNRNIVFLIYNPSVGMINGDNTAIADFLNVYDNSYTLIKPAFYYRNNRRYIEKMIKDYNLKNCMIICSGSTDPDNTDFQYLIGLEEIVEIVAEDPSSNRSLKRYMNKVQKNFIRLDDLFEKEARNSNFLELSERKFTEEHIYFEEEKYAGFSDYTILPSEYTDGGSAPRAVVIHLTYTKSNNEIWIKHFTSETNDSIANVQGKFAEAATKAVSFCKNEALSNSAIEELEKNFTDQHYPGLGTVKKISIKNHIIVVNEYLKTL